MPSLSAFVAVALVVAIGVLWYYLREPPPPPDDEGDEQAFKSW